MMPIRPDPDLQHCNLIIFWFRVFFVWIRIRGFVPLTEGSGSEDPSLFVGELQDAKKIITFSLLRYFLKVQ
jgi:hypothetical protein